MVDYKHIWKVRMIQLIVITAICAVSGIGTAISEKNLLLPTHLRKASAFHRSG